jgi:hypothetical protein
MSRERTIEVGLPLGPDPFSDGFHEASQGRVQVIHGVYSHTLPLAGVTVEHARRELADRMNIDPAATAVVDGVEVSEDAVLREGQMLNFVQPAGERGRGGGYANREG